MFPTLLVSFVLSDGGTIQMTNEEAVRSILPSCVLIFERLGKIGGFYFLYANKNLANLGEKYGHINTEYSVIRGHGKLEHLWSEAALRLGVQI